MNAADDPPSTGPIDYAALASRYLELWQEQVAKLGQDPSAVAAMFESWGKMIGAAGGFAPFAGKVSDAASGSATSGPTSASAPSGGGGLDHAALLRRIDALERRIAELEAGNAGSPAPRAARKPT